MPIKIDFSNKQALVIDASSTVRSSTMAMLAQLGFGQTKGSTTSSRALELVQQDYYDLVLIGHSAQERISGLQILEEARFKGLIKPSACWGFMSSDNTPEIILHAAQSEPNFVISKPFSVADLLKRLHAALSRKQAFRPINQALDHGDVEKAIELCDFVLTQNPESLSIQQFKADLLLQTENFSDAFKLLESINKVQPNKTTQLKICECLIGLKKYDIALKRLGKLISEFPLLLHAYDLKAMIYEARGQLEETRDALNDAVKISSMAIPRNLKLGKLALNTGQFDLAENAFKRSIQLNDGSCYRSPEPYLGLANVKRAEISVDGVESLAYEQRIDAVLKDAQTSFPDSPELKVQIALFRSQLQDDLQNEAGAQKYRELAERIVEENNLSASFDELKLEALAEVPKVQPAVVESVQAPRSSAERPAEPELSSKANLQGIKQYLAKSLPKALKYFTMSIELNRENSSALLNLAQLHLESLHHDVAARDKAIRMAKRYLSLAENLDMSDKQQQRYELLFNHLKKGIQQLPKGSLGMLLR